MRVAIDARNIFNMTLIKWHSLMNGAVPAFALFNDVFKC